MKKLCPRCGSDRTAKILYGMPAMSPKLMKQLDDGEVVLGGCCIMDFAPLYHCNKCKREFGAPTAFLEEDVKSLYFDLGGFLSGYSRITIVKTEDGAEVSLETGPCNIPENAATKQNLGILEWNDFIHNIFKCYLADWKKRYNDWDVLDGVQWELKIDFYNSKQIKISGSNKFPVYWDRFIKTLKQVGYSI